jgi:hypothetical protein
MLRSFIRAVLMETWGQNLDNVMEPSNEYPFDNDEEGKTMKDNPMNPYDANASLRTVKANAHPKVQRGGVKKGSGSPGGQRFPGSTRQGTSSVK